MLVTRQVGAGRVAFLTTTLDRDWSSLALDPGFVPLVERLIRWMCETQLNRARALPLFAGETWQAGNRAEILPRIESLDGRVLAVARAAEGFVSNDTNTPGLYIVRGETRDQDPLQRFAIRTNPTESETSTAPLDMAAQPTKERRPATEYEHRVPLWRTFALLALALMAVEVALRLWTSRRH